MKNILIIKLGSAGDVLRTTALLPELKAKYPESKVTWLVDKACCDVLNGNFIIDELVYAPYGIDALEGRSFDITFNLDNDRTSSGFMNTITSVEKKGFALDEAGEVRALSPEASIWQEMSLSDELKKKNTSTYHDIIHDIAGFARNKNRPILALTNSDMFFAEEFLERHGLSGIAPMIGVNLGGGERWRFKSPSSEKWIEIIEELLHLLPDKILIFGGKKEKIKYSEVIRHFGKRVIGSGTENSFGRFAALIGRCDVLITPDTLALHVGTALNKKIVVLFGPTSSSEIELYDSGIKIDSGMDCLCCYREECDKDPNCMSTLDPVRLAECVKEILRGE